MSDDREDRLGRLEAAIAALTTKIAVVTRPLRLAGGRHSTLYCSFCGKSQHEVDKLVAGPLIFICNECTDLCHGIVVLAGLRRGRICSGHGRVRLGLARERPPYAPRLDPLKAILATLEPPLPPYQRPLPLRTLSLAS